MKKYKIVEVEWLDAQTGFGVAEPIEENIERATYNIFYWLFIA